MIVAIQFDDYVQSDLTNCGCPVLYLNLQNKSHIKDSFVVDAKAVEYMISYGFDVSDDLLTLIENSFSDYGRFIALIQRYNSCLKKGGINADRIVSRINRLSRIR